MIKVSANPFGRGSQERRTVALADNFLSSLGDLFGRIIPPAATHRVEQYIPAAVALILVFFLAHYLKRLFRVAMASLLGPLRLMGERFEKNARTREQKKAALKKVKKLLEKQEYKPAAILLESVQELEKAAQYYTMADDKISAARIYENLDLLDSAAALYREAGNTTKAGDIYARIGDYGNAALMYENGGLLKKAAEIYEGGRDLGKAAELYEICFIEEAARGSSSAKESALKSGKLFEAIGSSEQALGVYLKADLHEKAAHVHETLKNFTDAGQYYLRAGSPEKAAECFALGGEDRKSNEILSRFFHQKGLLGEAASYAEKAGDLVQAAEICTEAGELLKAGELYLKAGWHNEAGEVFLRAGDLLRAADAFEKAGNFVLSAGIYQKAGVADGKVAELFEKGGEYFEAGNLYLRSGLPEKALNAYQAVEQGSENYLPASLLIGEIFMKKGMLKLAFQKFKQIIGNDQVNKTNIEAYYYLGRCLESAGEEEKARVIYGRVLAENYNFRDVEERIRQLQKTQTRKTV